MDNNRFDRLTRLAAAALSRRSVVGAAAAALAALGPGGDAGAACQAPGKPCDPDKPKACCSKRCSAQRRCLCTSVSQCPKPPTVCKEAVCKAGACKAPTNKRDGTACPRGRCDNGQCRCGDGPACFPGQRCENGGCCDFVVSTVGQLKAAMDQAFPGSTTCLTEGTYDLSSLPVNPENHELKVRANLRGAGAQKTIVKGKGSGFQAVLGVLAGENTIEGLTVTGGVHNEGPGGGIFIAGAILTTLKECVVRGNTAGNGGGIFVGGCGGDECVLKLIDTTVTNNTATNQGGQGAGGGIANGGILRLIRSSVSGNSADVPGTEDIFNG